MLRIDGFGGALVGLLPLDDRTALLARLGLHKLDIEEGFEAYEVKLARIVGVGAEWSPAGPLVLRLELHGIYGIHDRHASGTYQAASLTVGALYRFQQFVEERVFQQTAGNVPLTPRRSARACRASGG